MMTSASTLLASIDTLAGVGTKRIALLENLGVRTIGDLLFHIPRAYEDRRSFTPISSLAEGKTATICAAVVKSRAVRMRGRMSMAIVELRDESGTITATFFGRGFLAQTFTTGSTCILSGTVGSYKGLALKNPEYELLSGDEEDLLNTGCVVPVYRLTDKVTQRMLRRWVRTALDLVETLPELLPGALVKAHGFAGRAKALREVHFPETLESGKKARKRFAYEELLAIQVGVLRARQCRLGARAGIAHRVGGPLFRSLRQNLPFSLTGAQERAVAETLEDMASPHPMARLLQGDVGSGKTMVALHAITAAVDGGYQAAFMAPTEILAEQQLRSLDGMLAPLGVRVALLTGSSEDARAVRSAAAAGEVDVVVGTHALFQDATSFARLGLVVVDEQHRFGVMQRDRLAVKGEQVDVLQMTATPIPRTLTLTVYGGMDVTLLDELPPGRSPVKTRRIPEGKIANLWGYVREQAEKGLQTYVVCALVEESAKREDVKGAVEHFETLSCGALHGVRTGLLHGRMASAEKEEVMRAFKAGEIDVLFSTTVIEVGIDVPAATTMIIEDAGQFGLTQLHQLRGRVGRGSELSHCFLLGKPRTREGRKRLEVMVETTDGFVIAEEDLLLRGTGEFQGVRQAGMSELRVADLLGDARLLAEARKDAEALLARNVDWKSDAFAALDAWAREYEKVQL